MTLAPSARKRPLRRHAGVAVAGAAPLCPEAPEASASGAHFAAAIHASGSTGGAAPRPRRKNATPRQPSVERFPFGAGVSWRQMRAGAGPRGMIRARVFKAEIGRAILLQAACQPPGEGSPAVFFREQRKRCLLTCSQNEWLRKVAELFHPHKCHVHLGWSP